MYVGSVSVVSTSREGADCRLCAAPSWVDRLLVAQWEDGASTWSDRALQAGGTVSSCGGGTSVGGTRSVSIGNDHLD